MKSETTWSSLASRVFSGSSNHSRHHHPLYGHLLTTLLFSMIFPFVTLKIIKHTMGANSSIEMSETSLLVDDPNVGDMATAADISSFRLYLQHLLGMSTILCSGTAYFYSTHPPSSKVAAASSSNGVLDRQTRLWSYAAFASLTAAMTAVTLNNWPHVDEHTLPGHYCWNLVVCSANVSHSLLTKSIMGLITLLVGLTIVAVYPSNYPAATFVPLLLVITVVYWLAHYWIATGSRRGDEESEVTSNDSTGTPAVDSSVHLDQGASTTIPYSSAPPEEPMKQRERTLTWEAVRDYIAFGAIVCFVVYGFLAEVVRLMTEPGYFVTGSFNICQTGILGAAGFVASRVLSDDHDDRRQSSKIPTSEKNVDDDEEASTMFLASAAFATSATAMAVLDANRRHIEYSNPAFSLLSASMSSPSSTPFDTLLLDTLLPTDQASRRRFWQGLFPNVRSSLNLGTDYELKVQDMVWHVEVVSMSLDGTDAEAARVVPFTLTGLTNMKRQRHPRYLVLVKDVTWDRAGAVTTALQRDGAVR